MPFTFSHAAAVWPFQKTRLEMSALLVGCFAPDFAYFFFLSPHGLAGHSLPGMFLIDLPLSLVALWLFHAYMKQPATMLLPKGFRARLKPSEKGFSFWPPARLALVVVSILIGTATHILWDSFTHPFYWPYRHWSFLSKMVNLPIQGDVQMYKALQTGSTLFGLAVVAVWIGLWYRATEPVELAIAEPYTRAQTRVIMVVPALALVGGMIRTYVDQGAPNLEFRPILHFVVETGITATTSLGVGLLICGVVFRRRSAVKERIQA
jgi:Domain of unknown function (DUF4184)